MDTNKRKWIRYPVNDLISYSTDEDSEIVVQTLNKSHKGLAVVYVGDSPPDLGETVWFRIEEDTKPVKATLEWEKNVYTNVHILGFELTI